MYNNTIQVYILLCDSPTPSLIYYSENNPLITCNGMTLTNKENLKSQATMFIRKLVEFTNTLDVPPPDKWISMVLTVS